MALTDTKIQKLKPAARQIVLADGGGLYLRVLPSGTKSFQYRTRVGGKERWKALGVYPDMSLADARKACLEVDPSVVFNTTTATESSPSTVQQAYELWKAHVEKNYRSSANVTHRFEKHITPALGSATLPSVTRAQLSRVLTGVAATAPVQANRLLTDCKLFFGYCVERGWLENSPAALLTRKTVGGKERPRKRVLEDSEIVTLLRQLYAGRLDPKTRLALALVVFLGLRGNEVRGLSADELRPDGVWWVIPRDRMKASDDDDRPDHAVYMAPPVRRLVSLALRLGRTPLQMGQGALAHAVRTLGPEPAWTPHDLRRTMSTRMNEMGVAPYVVEKCLDHKMEGVMAVYNYAEYLPERRAAWRLWARRVLRLARQAKKSPGAC